MALIFYFYIFEYTLNTFSDRVLTLVPVVLQMTISQLKAELEKGPQEAAVYTQQIHELQSNLNNLQQQSQVTGDFTDTWQFSDSEQSALDSDSCVRCDISSTIRMCRIYFN